MKKIATFPLTENLSVITQWLSLQGLAHKIIEQSDQQVILLEDDRYEEQIKQAVQRYINDEQFKLELNQNVHEVIQKQQNQRKNFIPQNIEMYVRATPKQAPVIFFLIFVSIVFAWLSDFGQGGPFLRDLLILDPFKLQLDLNSPLGRWDGLITLLAKGEIWRVISPDFIHFNLMHITFNLLMLWVLGGQLELQKGSSSFIALVVFVSIISNIGQLLESTYLFGGMSGVVYGLVGYCWLWKYVEPDIFFPRPLLIFTLVWLVIGYTPLTEWLGWGRMANAAHFYGLIAGMLWAGVTLFVNEILVKKMKS